MSNGQITTLGAVVRRTGGVIQTGPFGSQLHASDYVTSGTPLVMPINIADNVIVEEGISRVAEDDVKRLARHQLRPGDIVFGRRGDVGRRSIVQPEQDGWLCGTGCLAVKFGKQTAEVNPEYVSLYVGVRKAQDWLAEHAVGGTMPNLNTRILSALPIWLPPRAEQDRTVESIGVAMSSERELARLLAKKRAIKQGLMHELLTGKTRLRGFVGPWQVVRLGDHVSYVKNVALSRAQLDVSSPLRYLHYGDIHTRNVSILDAASEEMPRASVLLAGNAGRLQIGDLVFADASEDPAGVGKSVEIIGVPAEGVVPGLHTIAARFDREVLADGFKAYLQFVRSFRDQLLALAAGTKVLATTRTYISSIELALPGVAEQTAIAKVLRDADTEIEALERRLAATKNMKTGIMQELLTERGKLNSLEAAA